MPQRNTRGREISERFAAAHQAAMAATDQAHAPWGRGPMRGSGQRDLAKMRTLENELQVFKDERAAMAVADMATGTAGLLSNAGIIPQSPGEAASLQANATQLVQGGMSPIQATQSIAGRESVREAYPQAQTAQTPQERANLTKTTLANEAAQRNAEYERQDRVIAAQPIIAAQQGKYLTQIAPSREVAIAYDQIGNALGTGDALGGEAALIKLAKILDPTSVVREGEVRTVKGGLGIGQQLLNSWNSAKAQGLTPESVQMVAKVVQAVAMPALKNGLAIRNEFSTSLDGVFGEDMPGLSRIITGAGIDWDSIETEIAAYEQAQ